MAVLACGWNALHQLSDSEDLALPAVVLVPDAVSLEAASASQSVFRNAHGALRVLGHPVPGGLPAASGSSPCDTRWLGHDELLATLGPEGSLVRLDASQIPQERYDLVELNGRGQLLAVRNPISPEGTLISGQGPRISPTVVLRDSLDDQDPGDYDESKSTEGKQPSTSRNSSPSPRRVVQIASGAAHFLALVAQGSHTAVYSVGDSRYGQTGPLSAPPPRPRSPASRSPPSHGDPPRQNPDPHADLSPLQPLDFFDGLWPSKVSCGAFHSAVVCQGGAAYVFGSHRDGQLGIGEDESGGADPVLIELYDEGPGARKGAADTAAAEPDPTAARGIDRHQQVGRLDSTLEQTEGSEATSSDPGPGTVETDDPVAIKQVACGAAHTVVLTESGQVWVTGMNHDGQLGLGDFTSRKVWTRNTLVERAVTEQSGCPHKRIKRVVCTRAATYFECE